MNIQKVILGDCTLKLKELSNDSTDIIIIDPPYNIGKDFGNNSDKQNMDDYLKWCDIWIAECIRILKPTGTMYIYGFSETLAFIRVRININVRWIIWHYTNKVTPSLKFWQRTHESILCCYKNTPHFNRDDVREPYTDSFLKMLLEKQEKPLKVDLVMEKLKQFIQHMKMELYLVMLLKYPLLQVVLGKMNVLIILLKNHWHYVKNLLKLLKTATTHC